MDVQAASGGSTRTQVSRLGIAALGVVSLVWGVWGTALWANPEATAPPEENVLIQLFERVSPAVVAVVAKRPPSQPPGAGDESRGSGVFLDRHGHLLTSAHFLHQAAQLTVIRADGQPAAARVVGLDRALNVALLRTDPPAESVFVPPLGDSSRVRVGQRAILIGNPLGLNPIMGVGIIGGISPILGTRTPFTPELVFETDITIKSPQFTGSPIFNRQGEVIGLSQVVLDDRRHLSFVLPINLVKEVLPELTTRGRVARPSLGVRGQILAATDPVLALVRLPLASGFLVEHVEAGSPAAFAGLRGGTLEVAVEGRAFLLGGDIITAIEGQRILTGADFTRATAALKAGEAVTITVLRQGKEVELGIRLAALPE
jgi:S1-C subfamily serine protease